MVCRTKSCEITKCSTIFFHTVSQRAIARLCVGFWGDRPPVSLFPLLLVPSLSAAKTKENEQAVQSTSSRPSIPLCRIVCIQQDFLVSLHAAHATCYAHVLLRVSYLAVTEQHTACQHTCHRQSTPPSTSYTIYHTPSALHTESLDLVPPALDLLPNRNSSTRETKKNDKNGAYNREPRIPCSRQKKARNSRESFSLDTP